MEQKKFRNREQAGRLLAKQLVRFKEDSPLVIALPRGGVPIGYEIAKTLNAPLEIVIVRKLGAPFNPEFGIGALAEDGEYWINEETARAVGAVGNVLSGIIAQERKEVQSRIQKLRANRPSPDVRNRTVLLVDDGIATGVTAIAAARYLRRNGAQKIIFAVPVGAKESLFELEREVDEVVCLLRPPHFYSVSLWYDHFEQLTDSEVVTLLGPQTENIEREISLKIETGTLQGSLVVPPAAHGVVIFAHGSGSSRHSPRNVKVANYLNKQGFGTLLFDLLLESESHDRRNIFDIALLADRLKLASSWLKQDEKLRTLPIGYFGASTGAAAALLSAAELGTKIGAVVSRGGRPDLAGPSLGLVASPTLLIVGGEDHPVLEWNQEALTSLITGDLVVIPGATHLFEEPGALELVCKHAVRWFKRYLNAKDKEISSDEAA